MGAGVAAASQEDLGGSGSLIVASVGQGVQGLEVIPTPSIIAATDIYQVGTQSTSTLSSPVSLAATDAQIFGPGTALTSLAVTSAAPTTFAATTIYRPDQQKSTIQSTIQGPELSTLTAIAAQATTSQVLSLGAVTLLMGVFAIAMRRRERLVQHTLGRRKTPVYRQALAFLHSALSTGTTWQRGHDWRTSPLLFRTEAIGSPC